MEGGGNYWCHMCSQTVNPLIEVELKCPVCMSGFVEEMDSPSRRLDESETDLPSESALALWAPILLGMLDDARNRQGIGSQTLDENSTDDENEDGERTEGETEIDMELDLITRRRMRSSAAVLQFLQGIGAGISAEFENREQESVILYDPVNQTILVQSSNDSTHDPNSAQNHPYVSVSDYFAGPDLDLLQQLLAENDSNRYGTPPAQKEAVDALSTVEVEENLQCPVCLDVFEVSAEAKEMPCKHKFHSGCLLPWLELHSSCPVCRFQLPADESKFDAAATRGSRYGRDVEQGGSENGFTFPWPLSGLSSTSRHRGNPSRSPSASSSSGGPGAGSH